MSLEIDYKSVGLKVGLEIHQQLKSERKLFCFCKPKLVKKEPEIIIKRFMRPTLSETGEIDPTMLKEFKKRKLIIYEAYLEENCLYEIDEVPPYEVDREALKSALIIAKLFNTQIPDVVIVSRKQYLDGSVPTGFQRTMIIGLNGYLEISNGKKIGIEQICLEEDAARKIRESEKEIVFRVDRLGIPLVEITTAADLNTPEEVLDAALRIGALLRSTGVAMRGLGTIRQDINISIKTGNRVEIKGVQRPEWFKKIIDNEIIRQMNLIKIKNILIERKVLKEDIASQKPKEITDLFSNTKANFIIKSIKKGAKVYALVLPGFSGLLGTEVQPNKRFGKEFAERVRVIVGLKGIIHTDELPAYGITQEEKDKLFNVMNARRNLDCIVFVVGNEEKCLEALEEVKERAKQALDGVPMETRRANEDGTTSFERPLGTAARLYPDTDTPPVVIDRDLLKYIEEKIPEYPWILAKKYSKELNIKEGLIYNILLSERNRLFEKAIKMNIDPKLVVNTLTQTVKYLRRDGFNIDEIPDEKFLEVFMALKDGKMSKEAIPEVLKKLSENKDLNIDDILTELGITGLSEADLRKIIIDIIERNIKLITERGERAFGPLMGDVMKIVRGKADGKIVSKILSEILKEKLKNLE